MNDLSLNKSPIILLLASVFFYFYAFILQIFLGSVTNYLRVDYKFSVVQIGYLSAAFYLSYAPMQMLAGFLLDRCNVINLLIGMWIFAGLGVCWFGSGNELWELIIARFLMGVATSGAFIMALYLGKNWLKAEHFAVFTGVVEWLGALGGVLGTVPFLYGLRYFSWTSLLKGLGGIGILVGSLIWFFKGGFVPKEREVTEHKPPLSFLKDRQVWIIALYSFLVWGPILVIAGLWGIDFLKIKFEIGSIEAAATLSWLWWGIATVSLVLGYLAKWVRVPKLMFMVSAVGCLALAYLIWGKEVLGIRFLLFLIGGAGAGQTLGFIWLGEKVKKELRGFANGFNNLWIVVGGVILPILISYNLDYLWSGNLKNGIKIYQTENFQYSLSWLIGCYLVATLLSCLLWRKDKNN